MLKQHQTDSVLQLLKVTASWNSVHRGRRQVYGNINHTGSGTSINVFSFFTSIAR